MNNIQKVIIGSLTLFTGYNIYEIVSTNANANAIDIDSLKRKEQAYTDYFIKRKRIEEMDNFDGIDELDTDTFESLNDDQLRKYFNRKK